MLRRSPSSSPTAIEALPWSTFSETSSACRPKSWLRCVSRRSGQRSRRWRTRWSTTCASSANRAGSATSRRQRSSSAARTAWAATSSTRQRTRWPMHCPTTWCPRHSVRSSNVSLAPKPPEGVRSRGMGLLSQPETVEIPDDVWASDQLSPFLARLAAEHGPIFTFVPAGGPHRGQPVVYMVGPEANRFVFLSGREHFSHDLGWTPVVGETLGHGLLNMDPPEHTRHRALMNPAFTANFMAAYLPLMQRIIAERSGSWPAAGEIDLTVEARE